jgi:sialate O-acetylesterase
MGEQHTEPPAGPPGSGGMSRRERGTNCRRSTRRARDSSTPDGAAARAALAVLAAGALLGCVPRGPSVRLAALFADRMVVQRGVPVPVWGSAGPGERVEVDLGDARSTATADAAGRWLVRLPPLAPGGPFELKVTAGETVTLHDVMVGDVWVCSGQSNMSFPLEMTGDAERAIAASSHPDLRMFTVLRNVAERPGKDVGGVWQVSGPRAARMFSAVAYHFGRELHEHLRVPIGLIHASWSGTPIEAWMSPTALGSNPGFRSIYDGWAKKVAENAAEIAEYEPVYRAWHRYADKAIDERRHFPQQPHGPEGPRHHYYPSNTYHAMMAPLAPYAIRGFIWYQGEGNRDRPAQYRELFPALIQDLRGLFGQGDVPFLFVQLASYGKDPEVPAASPTAELREAQAAALSLPGTGMVVTTDIGDPADVHPRNKREVGRRLALVARSISYGEALVSSGPVFAGVAIEGSALRVRFRSVGGGLTVREGTAPRGFAIAGADGRFVWAEARIEQDTVVVWSDRIEAPVSVRYAWANSPDATLMNQEGLPAAPSRASASRSSPWP